MLAWDLEGKSLASNTQYFWRVDAKNVDVTTHGAEYSFTTTPEPSSMLALAAGLVGFFGIIRRKKA
jgi:hypothetical protein